MQASPQHRYYPITLILPDYVPNERDLLSIAAEFSVLWVVLLSAAWLLMARYVKELGTKDRLTVLWFVLCQYQIAGYVAANAYDVQVAHSMSSSRVITS